MGGGGGNPPPVPGLSGGRGGLPPGPPRGGSGPGRPIGRPAGGGGGRGPERTDDWFLPRAGGLSFGGGGRAPDRVGGGAGLWLLSELFLWGRRGEGSSPPPGVGGKEGGPGRPGGRGGAPPPGVGREGEEEATDGEGLELTEGGGGGMSRGIDGRCPPGAGGGGGRSSGSGGLPPGAGGKGGLLLFEGGGGGEEKLGRGPGVEPPGGGGRGPCLPDGMLGGPDGDPWPGLGPVGSDGGDGPPRDGKD